jgi:hypothetical protein
MALVLDTPLDTCDRFFSTPSFFLSIQRFITRSITVPLRLQADLSGASDICLSVRMTNVVWFFYGTVCHSGNDLFPL